MWVAFRSFVTIVCSQPSPQLRAKFAGILRQHMANAHNVGVVWFNCEVEGCNYRAKVKGSVTRHMTSLHGIPNTGRKPKVSEPPKNEEGENQNTNLNPPAAVKPPIANPPIANPPIANPQIANTQIMDCPIATNVSASAVSSPSPACQVQVNSLTSGII